ncbi:MAG: TRAP transporter large permease subunit [Desulfobacula sp.]|uniref:TRAP transporter large permease n=1 Tax=Desulfobacula sp. TaxID=2593537 RepID=UPI0025B893B1|nr:TRAP transporter large permease subunit [Desulfobacula sp.]MCD4720703.1 TRAP transporter large permease subunit [Desulfobacula sp.]
MGIELITLLLFGSMLLLLLTGFPISYGLGAIAMVFSLWLWGPQSLFMGYLAAVSTVNYTVLVCIPMFVFMGMMLYYSGIADDLFDTFQNWLAPVPGGLASATVGVCTMIAALVSSEAAGTLTMGRIALPLMRKRGYQKEIAVGCIQAGAALGFLVPPSCIAILYAVIAKESIGRLFLGGAIPGFMLALMYIIYITVRCYLQPHIAPPVPKEERASWNEKVKSLKNLIMPCAIIFSVVGTIMLGLTTPVESAAIGVLGGLIAVAIKKRLNLKLLKDALMDSSKLTAIMMWIFMGAMTFGQIYDALGAKELIYTVTTALPLGPWGILIMIQCTFFILGMFMDDTAILFITMPIYIPIISELGFDPVWFGVLYIINMQMAYMTPPFGYCLMLIKGVVPPDISMADIYRSVIPFVIIQGVALALIMIFPELVLWLPRVMLGGG